MGAGSRTDRRASAAPLGGQDEAIEIYNANTQFLSQRRRPTNRSKGRVVDAQALGCTGLGQLAQGEVLGQPHLVSPDSR
jgi:hypothetical protein